MVEGNGFLEWAQLGGHRYGTPRDPLDRQLDNGAQALLSIDVRGARQVRAAVPRALFVWLARPASTGPAGAGLAGAGLAGGFDITLVITSVEGVCGQLVALVLARQGDRAPGGDCNSDLEGTRWQGLRP
jgi:guanylate kinase